MSSVSLPWPFGRREKRRQGRKEEDLILLEELGVTQKLLDFVKGFTVDTFRNFPLEDNPTAGGDLDPSSGRNQSKDLSEWQERHAMILLARSKEISQIRYVLCPRLLQDNQFWRIYFLLVKSYVVPYEVRAIQKAKLKDLEKKKSCEKVEFELEMTESKLATRNDDERTDELQLLFSRVDEK